MKRGQSDLGPSRSFRLASGSGELSIGSVVKVGDLCDALEQLAPPQLAEDYDNVGLLVGDRHARVASVLVALDVTPAILEEAKAVGASMVVSHHPIWFRPRRTLVGDDFAGVQIVSAIRSNIALFACHTNLDNHTQGVNRTIADRLDLQDCSPLRPREQGPPTVCAGSGLVGRLRQALDAEELLSLVRERFNSACIRYAPGPGRIERVAVCGGAGSFLLEDAVQHGADAYITADVTYHHFFEARSRILFMDIGHYESEQFAVSLLETFLKKEFPGIVVRAARGSTNPVRYFF
ncbi:MAG: Nif3-like dinuclear metal center hexameric protein [Spirochaetales bacterium]|nr:Nif3-like dinuclear metal center hexameric protein [Spirochaetales bacterium]